MRACVCMYVHDLMNLGVLFGLNLIQSKVLAFMYSDAL